MKDIIKAKLLEQGYDAKSATLVASELTKIEPSLELLLNDWLGGKETDFEAEGYSISGLMKSRRMTYPAALLTIDWLLKEPSLAQVAISKGVK